MKKTCKRVFATSVSMALVLTNIVPAFAKTTDSSISKREEKNAELSMNLATQGMVLLENNNNVLPIASNANIALFGGGAYSTIKGGTGSGDVNQRSVTSVWDGFNNAGYNVTSTDWLNAFKVAFEEGGGSTGGVSGAKLVPDIEVTDEQIEKAKEGNTDTAVYVIVRSSGEFSDRKMEDYYLTDIEKANIEKMSANFENSIVVLNVGGIMDTKFFDEIEDLDSLLLMSQAGMRSGDAVVKVLNGEVTPSGKLTDTWAVNYEDYSSSDNFGANDGNISQEDYTDDIYVGYRYFDTFNVTPAYEFGYGLSYTDFNIDVKDVTVDSENVTVNVKVTNTGKKYSGKEVVQVYFSTPEGELEKPYQELAAYGKTDVLDPGESQILTLSYTTTEMSSYSEDKAAYIMEAGDYLVRVGNSSRNTHVEAVATLDNSCITEQLSNQKVQDEDITTLSNKGTMPYTYAGEADEIAAAKKFVLDSASFKTENNASPYKDQSIKSYVYEGSDYEAVDQENNPRYTKEPDGKNNTTPSQKLPAYEEKVVEIEKTLDNPTLLDVYQGKVSMEEFLASLTPEEMSYIVEGIGWGGNNTPIIGAQSNSVKGAAGETTSNYYETRAIPNIVLADGPAGIRITQSYKDNGTTYYQYCTAFPIGTLIAQSWDKDVAEEFGKAIGEEMIEMGVTMWLAPGMNIHRNPLCGRNFEYYSEDPLISGVTAASTTLGVQSYKGIGVTIKHYAGNNQEDNRNAVNNTITERAFREIYLKGFEIVVKTANPLGIMTSYNLNNSMPAADDYELCTDLARGEWGFNGLIMTDWGGGQSTPVNSMHAGNDLIMPGGSSASIRAAVEDVAPEFGNDGYVRINRWNDFILDANGTVSVTATIEKGSTLNEKVNAKVEEGTAVINYADDQITPVSVTYKGEYKNNTLPLGDLQKATRNVLNVIMDSIQFKKIGTENGVDVEIGKFSKSAGLSLILDVAKSNITQVNKVALSIAVEVASAVTDKELDALVPAVANEFKEALEEAKIILADQSASQETVDASFDRLAKAIQMLDFIKGDKSNLQLFVNKVKDLNSEEYTSTTWNNFIVSLETAESVLKDVNALEQEVNETYDGLVRAYLNLRYKPNKNILNDLVNKAEELNAANYTQKSWGIMQTALLTAKEVLTNEDATQHDVDVAHASLTKAIEGLVVNTNTPEIPMNPNESVNSNVSDSVVNSGDKKVSVSTGDTVNLIYPITGLAIASMTIILTTKKKKHI